MIARTRFDLGIVVIAFAFCLSLTNLSAQTPPPKRKPIKDFGSSLKNIKWNPARNSGVEIIDANRNRLDEDDVIRIDTSLVTSDVLVVDKEGHHVSGLTADDFEVKEDGESQKVEHFYLGDNAIVPRAIVLIIDYSGSQAPYLKTSIEAAKTLVNKLGPLDHMAIVTDDVELVCDFTNDRKKLKKELDSIYDRATKDSLLGFRPAKYGRSDQYSALFATLNEAFQATDQRPIVVFQTDGDEVYRLRNPIIVPTIRPDLAPEDVESAKKTLETRLSLMDEDRKEYSIDDIYRAVEKSRATIYTIIPGFRYLGLNREQKIKQAHAEYDELFKQAFESTSSKRREQIKANQERSRLFSDTNLLFRAETTATIQSALTVVSTLTGGWTDFLERPSQADDIYSRIFTDINQRYIIGYYPTNKNFDGKRRSLAIQVRNHPEYKILGRKTYYSAGAK